MFSLPCGDFVLKLLQQLACRSKQVHTIYILYSSDGAVLKNHSSLTEDRKNVQTVRGTLLKQHILYT